MQISNPRDIAYGVHVRYHQYPSILVIKVQCCNNNHHHVLLYLLQVNFK